MSLFQSDRRDILPFAAPGDDVRQNEITWTWDKSRPGIPETSGGADDGSRHAGGSGQVRWYREHGASEQMELACRSSTMRHTPVPLSERN